MTQNARANNRQGPLTSVRVLDFTGLGPGPYCAGLLGDMGADVVRIERPGSGRFAEPHKFVPHRSRRSIVVDLTTPEGIELALLMVDTADVLIEGNRPGVMERLGLGPDTCALRNPRLIYGRMTGWGQEGPMANEPGHDVNYLAMIGALGRFQRHGERPLFPLNLAADLGGGGMLLALGIVSALFERASSGLGQVIDAAMIDGVAGQLGMVHAHKAMDRLHPPGENFYDSGAHYYEVYETSDQRHLALGALEPKFYAELLALLGLTDDRRLSDQNDRSGWPSMKAIFANTISRKTLAEWTEIFRGSQACASPVLTIDEAMALDHHVERGTFTRPDGVVQADVAPRFSRTPGSISRTPPATGQHTIEVLLELGLTAEAIDQLHANNTVQST